MKNRSFTAIRLLFLPTILLSFSTLLAQTPDSALFVRGGDTVVIDLGQPGYPGDIGDGGKIYICPDEYGLRALVYRLGPVEEFGANYTSKRPDTNIQHLWEVTAGIEGTYIFTKVSGENTYTVYVTAIGVRCPVTAPAPDGPICYDAADNTYELPVQEAYSAYLWHLVPESAGGIVPAANSATVTLDEDFDGKAMLWVVGQKGSAVDYDDTLFTPLAITRTASVEANFSFTNEGNTFTFNNLSQNANHYSWDFDDGQTSTLTSPVHAFASQGDYAVRLVASRYTCSDEHTLTVLHNQLAQVSGEGRLCVFPNPFSDQEPVLSSATPVVGPVHLTLYNAQGSLVWRETLNGLSNNHQLSIEGIRPGLYVLTVSTVGGCNVLKINKQ